jgi:hypothetical protein
MSLQASLPKDGGKSIYVEIKNIAMRAKTIATDIPSLPPPKIAFKYARYKSSAINVKKRKDIVSLNRAPIIKEKMHKTKSKSVVKVKTLLLRLRIFDGLINR